MRGDFHNQDMRFSMKKCLVLTLFLFALTTNANGQIVVNSTFKPLSYDELLLQAQAQAYHSKMMEEKFDEYQDKAYEQYNRGDYRGFIYYSDIALSTGWYNTQLYYDRGNAYEYLHDYKHAKKEYKKAKKKGYYPAVSALEQCKRNEKAWRKSH